MLQQIKCCLWRGQSLDQAPPHLVVHPLDVGDVHVVSGGADILILLTREDVNAHQVDLHDKHTHVQCVFKSYVFCLPKNDQLQQRRKHVPQTEHMCALEIIWERIQMSVYMDGNNSDRDKPTTPFLRNAISFRTYWIRLKSSNWHIYILSPIGLLYWLFVSIHVNIASDNEVTVQCQIACLNTVIFGRMTNNNIEKANHV